MIDTKLIQQVEVEGIDHEDYPKYCDACITYAEYKDGTKLNEAELEELNEDYEFVHQKVFEKIF